MTEPNKHIDKNIIIKFIIGEVTDGERNMVLDWLNASSENKNEFDKIEQIWLESGKLRIKPVVVDKKQAWQKVSALIDEDIVEAEQEIKSTNKLRRIIPFASAIAAAIVVGLLIFSQFNQAPEPIVFSSLETVIEEQQLPDGSTVSLNKNTELKYVNNPKTNTRELNLQGEAFFKVKPDSEKPFIIDAGLAKVRVVGTQFNVKADTAGEVIVTVTEGVVEMFTVNTKTHDTAKVVLTAGEKGIVTSTNLKPIEEKAKTDNNLFWTNKTLIFTDTEMDKVIWLLQKNFNVKIEVSTPAINRCLLTTSFEKNNIDEILEIIAFTFNLEVKKENNKYLLVGTGCTANE